MEPVFADVEDDAVVVEVDGGGVDAVEAAFLSSLDFLGLLEKKLIGGSLGSDTIEIIKTTTTRDCYYRPDLIPWELGTGWVGVEKDSFRGDLIGNCCRLQKMKTKI